jgi:pyruvate dehydrogenase E1 component alpha subunit
VEKSCKAENLYTIGQGYGIDSCMVDGNDVLKVHEAMLEAVKKCRGGKGPVLIEAKTYRHGGHHVNDPGAYMPKERLDYYKSKDPVDIGKAYAMKLGKASEKDIEKIDTAVAVGMEEAIAFAKQSPEMSQQRFFELVENY